MSDAKRHTNWKAGHKAGLEGKSEDACTLNPGTIFYDDWHDGWREGFDCFERAQTARPTDQFPTPPDWSMTAVPTPEIEEIAASIARSLGGGAIPNSAAQKGILRTLETVAAWTASRGFEFSNDILKGVPFKT